MIKTCALFLCLTLPATSVAGNKWMMNQNAKQLIELNNQLINEIEPIGHGKVHIEALVFGSGSANENTVYQLTPAPTVDWSKPGEASSLYFNRPATKIRIGIINVGPGFSETINNSPKASSGKALASFDDAFFEKNGQLKTILEKHPQAKYLDLKGGAINIDVDDTTQEWNEPKYLIYW
ncbi:MAG: hypothetical protein HOM11_14355 [Methylococcales bacterium]|nr:hypothetical protein [Methylococcales bacterium]MBT7442764.1 hypothetical protein [Methylococcales bacterium]